MSTVLDAEPQQKMWCVNVVWLFLKVYSGQSRGRILPTHLTAKQKKRWKLPANCSNTQTCQSNSSAPRNTQTHIRARTHTHTYSPHKSMRKRTFTHKPTFSNSQAPSKAFKHSGRSIGFQEASNTQVEPPRLWPSYSALSLTTQEEPCWALGQEPKIGK